MGVLFYGEPVHAFYEVVEVALCVGCVFPDCEFGYDRKTFVRRVRLVFVDAVLPYVVASLHP